MAMTSVKYEHKKELVVAVGLSSGKTSCLVDNVVNIFCRNRLPETQIFAKPGLLWILSCRGKESKNPKQYRLSETSDQPIYEVRIIRRSTYRKNGKGDHYINLLKQNPNLLIVVADTKEINFP